LKKQNEGKPKFTFEIAVFVIFSNTSPVTRDVFFEYFWVNQDMKFVF